MVNSRINLFGLINIGTYRPVAQHAAHLHYTRILSPILGAKTMHKRMVHKFTQTCVYYPFVQIFTPKSASYKRAAHGSKWSIDTESTYMYFMFKISLRNCFKACVACSC